ncbi:flagellar M-ring protein FliF [Nocardioides humilatus]|uniref:Flagellar M-ring protein n=1 Tax=Nocardioides humilatus TaxID=2607660 RepID=A0A5B1LDM0_9ACTN|nr:flagellar basal-body MS-ring/collar protein FliF [Nocardioides humilatus]KAA1417707.1 flagellar M-ring protein FliF [Nocardioides humilatus]
MRTTMNRSLDRARQMFLAMSIGQRMAVIVGTAALLVGGFLVVRWVSTPSYAPLYTDLSGADASAVVDELEAEGVPYKITDGGSTVMVPRSDVYSTRIALSGQGLPAGGDSGYSILDNSDLTTSEFKEQTNFKRAMEGELASTIEAIDGVDNAVVHLSIPEKQVFSDDAADPTASVLVDTEQGSTLAPEQVQAVVHLVASSIEGLDPKAVTVADSTGTVLTSPDTEDGVGGASTQAALVREYEEGLRAEIQSVLDRVVGPGNSTLSVTATLNFDTAVTDTRTYQKPEKNTPPISESTSTETYNGSGNPNNTNGGVVGPDGQMDPTGNGSGEDASYENSQVTRDNPVGEVVEHRESAPGSVQNINIGVALDATKAASVQEGVVRDLIAAAIGINAKRGDKIAVSKIPFDRSGEEAAAAELAAADAADARTERNNILMAVALSLGIALLILMAWFQAHRRAKRREKATTYVVEQLRADAAARAVAVEPAPAMAVLEASTDNEASALQDELQALVEKQPEDVAALLRGWLVDPR